MKKDGSVIKLKRSWLAIELYKGLRRSNHEEKWQSDEMKSCWRKFKKKFYAIDAKEIDTSENIKNKFKKYLIH